MTTECGLPIESLKEQVPFLAWSTLQRVASPQIKEFYDREKGVTRYSIYSVYFVSSIISEMHEERIDPEDKSVIFIVFALNEQECSVCGFGDSISSAIAKVEEQYQVKRFLKTH